MATNTYVALDKITVGSAVTSVTFSSISSAYTDLVLVIQGSSSALQSIDMQFNGDTGSNYSATRILGSGSAASSARDTNVTRAIAGFIENGQTTSIVQLQNYSNTTTYKTSLVRLNSPASYTGAYVNLWRSTAAINSIYLFNDAGGTFNSGSTFSLYGIKAEVGESTPKATGGVVTSDATYWYHTFTSVGNFVPNQSLTCDYLVVAGGGGGGGRGGGGGGAGGLLTSIGGSTISVTAQNYGILVGAGGKGGSGADAQDGTSGTSSVFSSASATGGGAGGTQGFNGIAGGSGGGGATGGAGTSGQGYAGGNSGNYGAGGGGAGAVGAAGGTYPGNIRGGNGGVGLANSITGTSTYYAGGGGGGCWDAGTPGTGGNGGGGAGGTSTSPQTGTAGTANTGGGGGGGGHNGTGSPGYAAGNGGSGLVIIRYAK